MQFETFTPLSQVPFLVHAFTLRTSEDSKAEGFEERLIGTLGFSSDAYASAAQPHGNSVAVPGKGARLVPHVDALVTREAGLPLVIRCADCAAVFIMDRRTPAIALIHSGKKGTAGNVVGNVIRRMQMEFATQAADCFAFIGPSIGPCHYEMDLWSGIEQQLRDAGLREIHNPRVCTACHLDRYFSYRAEKGNTGRMFAVLALKPQ